MISNNKNLVLIGLLVVIVGLGGIWTYIKYRTTSDFPVADLGLVTYVNAQGQEWSVPKGEYEFKVSSEKKYPKFVTGFINPVDVKVGDIQKMLMAIDSDTPIKRVWAEIETDNTVRAVEMKIESSAPVSIEDYKNQPYLVDEDGVLVINNEENKETFTTKLTKIAEAADGVIQYRYEGEWIVEDTHTKTYHTRFVVEDEKGRLDSMTLAWSDPVCVYDSNGVLQNSCTPTGGVEGFDSASTANSSIGSTLTINLTNTTLAFNPGARITLAGGSILIGSGSKIQQRYMCVLDADSDGYPVDVTRYLDSDPACDTVYQAEQVNARRLYQSPNTADCDDNNANSWIITSGYADTDNDGYGYGAYQTNACLGTVVPANNTDCDNNNGNVFPGQTSYFTTAITGGGPKNGTYDYNCNGSDNAQYANVLGGSGGHTRASACYYSAGSCLATTNSPNDGFSWKWIEGWPQPADAWPGCGNSANLGAAVAYQQVVPSCSAYNGAPQVVCENAGATTLIEACR